jgi:hypothetical protein
LPAAALSDFADVVEIFGAPPERKKNATKIENAPRTSAPPAFRPLNRKTTENETLATRRRKKADDEKG